MSLFFFFKFRPPRSLRPSTWVRLGDAKKRISVPEGLPNRLSGSRKPSCSLKAEAEALSALPSVSPGGGSEFGVRLLGRGGARRAAWGRRAWTSALTTRGRPQDLRCAVSSLSGVLWSWRVRRLQIRFADDPCLQECK